MKFYKEAKTEMTTGWVFEINGKQVPLEVLNQFWKPLLITLLLINAYDMGIRQAQEYIKFFYLFHETKGFSCVPVQNALYIDWNCSNSTKDLNTGTFNISALR